MKRTDLVILLASLFVLAICAVVFLVFAVTTPLSSASAPLVPSGHSVPDNTNSAPLATANPASSTLTDLDAYQACKAYADQTNRFPYGASWPVFDWTPTNEGDLGWTISAWLRVTNDHGANERVNYVCSVDASGAVASLLPAQ